jgi:hypothetical protein
MDEVASDGCLCYLTATDEIVGLCEHVTQELNSVKMGKDLCVARAIRQVIQDGKVHVGQEIFVAAFAQKQDRLWGLTSLVDANMQMRLVSRCHSHYGDAPTSMEDITIWQSTPWYSLVDSFRWQLKVASCALSLLHDSGTYAC